MGLENLNLLPVVLQELYTTHLVGDADAIKPSDSGKTSSFKALGGNEKHISVLVHCEKSAFLPDAHLSFLVKILEACTIHMSDAGIINTCAADKNFYDLLLQEMEPAVILLFDVDMAALGFPLSIPHYQVQKYSSMHILSMPNLADIQKDTAIKNKVWTGLKKIFSV